MIKFPTEYGVGEVREDQVAVCKCYIDMLEMDDHLQTMCIEEQQMVAEPMEGLEEVLLDNFRLEQTTRIDTLASPAVQQALAAFLRENQDVFAWSYEDMPEIDPSIIVHKLNVSHSFPLFRKKKWVFTQEQDKAIAEEVHKLQEAEFIQEVYYLDWLANIVMVKKANQKWRMCVDFTDLNKACTKDNYPLVAKLHGCIFWLQPDLAR